MQSRELSFKLYIIYRSLSEQTLKLELHTKQIVLYVKELLKRFHLNGYAGGGFHPQTQKLELQLYILNQ